VNCMHSTDCPALQSSLAEESGASVESAARVGQQQREHGSIAYEQPAVVRVRWP